MSDSNFMKLTVAECGLVYPVLQSNVDRHFRIASFLAIGKEYGNAVAHLILGTEELMKTLVIFLDYKEFGIRKIKGVNQLFYIHKSRHNILKEVFSVWRFLQPIITINKISFKTILKGFIIGGLTAHNNYQWWDRADQLKQKAFYVGYSDRLIDPSEISERDYKEALSHVESVKKEVMTFINYVQKMSEDDLSEFRRNFVDADLEELLKQTIEGKTSKNK